MSLLEIEGLRKSYRAPDGSVQTVLSIERFSMERGERMGMRGESGSGKTTLLHTIAGILRPDAGSIRILDTDLARLGEAERDLFRAKHVGYVFQSFHLLGGYSALENVLLGMVFGHEIDRAEARGLLVRLGLEERLHHRPAQLSIGQQQRVALARALAGRPELVLADEPTGNLDRARADEALELLSSLCRERGAALLCVSHDPAVLSHFERVVDLADLQGRAPVR
jgi:putative ABC transport system ATP-binding protein